MDLLNKMSDQTRKKLLLVMIKRIKKYLIWKKSMFFRNSLVLKSFYLSQMNSKICEICISTMENAFNKYLIPSECLSLITRITILKALEVIYYTDSPSLISKI